VAHAVDHLDRAVGPDLPARDAADADQALEAVVVQRRDLHLERAVLVHLRRRAIEDGLEQAGHVAVAHVRLEARVTLQRRGVDDREVELLVGRAEAVEQVEGLVDDPVRAGARGGRSC
jgi:hypothetical protein